MSGELKSISVVAGVVWKDEAFLCCQRPQGKAQAGFWEFPGGKIEAGESPEAALERELREELGIQTKSIRFWKAIEHVYPERSLHVSLRLFHVDAFEGLPSPKEGQDMVFMTPKGAMKLPFLAADLPLVEELCKNAPQN